MKTITLLDTAVGSTNKGDEIIMKCIYEGFSELFDNYFILSTPTHLQGNSFIQSIGRKLPTSAQAIADSTYKFVCGTNLINNNMLRRTNQWNVNLFNIRYIENSICIGVGKLNSPGKKGEFYTKALYKKLLNQDYIHSVRDENTFNYFQSLGLKVLNTRCVTMWKLKKDFCKTIRQEKADSVVFTLTDYNRDKKRDLQMVNIIMENYNNIYFWPQGMYDEDYLKEILPVGIEKIHILAPNVNAYEKILSKEIDYIGTRLHAGIFALRNSSRSIIISIDDRMNGLKKYFSKEVFVNRNDIEELNNRINSKIVVEVDLDENAIHQFKQQFIY